MATKIHPTYAPEGDKYFLNQISMVIFWFPRHLIVLYYLNSLKTLSTTKTCDPIPKSDMKMIVLDL